MFRIAMAHLPGNDLVTINVSIGVGKPSLTVGVSTWKEALEWISRWVGFQSPAIPETVNKQLESEYPVLIRFEESLVGAVSVELLHHGREIARVVSSDWPAALSTSLSLIETPGLG